MSDYIKDLEIGECGNGWFVRISGTNIFDDVNEYGCKCQRSLSITECLKSKPEAQQAAKDWLVDQMNKICKEQGEPE